MPPRVTGECDIVKNSFVDWCKVFHSALPDCEAELLTLRNTPDKCLFNISRALVNYYEATYSSMHALLVCTIPMCSTEKIT